MMHIYLLLLLAFLASLWIYCIYAIMNPDRTVEFALKRCEDTFKFYKFEGSVKKTVDSQKIIIAGHQIVLIILTIYILISLYVITRI